MGDGKYEWQDVQQRQKDTYVKNFGIDQREKMDKVRDRSDLAPCFPAMLAQPGCCCYFEDGFTISLPIHEIHREDRNGNDPNFVHPTADTIEWEMLLQYGGKHKVDDYVCSTCVPPPAIPYFGHNLTDRVIWMGCDVAGATGTVTWISRDRSHVRVRMDEGYKPTPGIMSAAKFKPCPRKMPKGAKGERSSKHKVI